MHVRVCARERDRDLTQHIHSLHSQHTHKGERPFYLQAAGVILYEGNVGKPNAKSQLARQEVLSKIILDIFWLCMDSFQPLRSR